MQQIMALRMMKIAALFESCATDLENPNMLRLADDAWWSQHVLLYKITSVCYYRFDNPIMADPTFDKLCRILRQHPAPEEAGLDLDALDAGTGYHINDPSTVALANYVVRYHMQMQQEMTDG